MLLKMALALLEMGLQGWWASATEIENVPLEILPTAVLEGHEPFRRWSCQTNEGRPDDEGEQKSQAEPSRRGVAAAGFSWCGEAARLIVLSSYLSLHNFRDESPPWKTSKQIWSNWNVFDWTPFQSINRWE